MLRKHIAHTLALLVLGFLVASAALAQTCADGQLGAAQLVKENSKLETTLTGEPKESGGTYSLVNIITTHRDEFTTLCEADVLFEHPDPAVALNFSGRMREHITHSVNLTDDNSVFVKVHHNNVWILEETQAVIDQEKVRVVEKRAVFDEQQKLNKLELAYSDDPHRNQNTPPDHCRHPDKFILTNLGCEIRGKQQGKDGNPIPGSASSSMIAEARKAQEIINAAGTR